MGIKRQALWVGVAVLIVALIVATISYYMGYRQMSLTRQNKLYALEEKVKESVFENFKKGVSPTRTQIFMTLRSVARNQGIASIDSTSLDRVVENVTARILQDSLLKPDEKMDLLTKSETIAAPRSRIDAGYKDVVVNKKSHPFWNIAGLVVLAFGLAVIATLAFVYNGPHRMTQSSLGSLGTLINYLYNRYESDLAMSLVEENIVQSPRNPQLYANKARLFLREGRVEEALNTINQCLEISPISAKPYLILIRAVCLSKLGQQQEAIDDLNRAQKGFWGRVHSFLEPFYFLSSKIEVYASNNEIEEAVSESNKLITKFPKSPFAFSIRAQILRRAGKVEDSLMAAERSIELARGQSDPTKYTRITGLLHIAAAYAMLERFEESFDILSNHLPYRSSSLTTIENMYGFEKLLTDNIYGKKLKDLFRDHKKSQSEMSEGNIFL